MCRVMRRMVPGDMCWVCPYLSPLPAWNHLKSNARCNPDAPVFAAHYTVLDGGVVMGLCAHHGVMDGTGIAEFIRF
jgi:chloramphenicol O-acetyltransferase